MSASSAASTTANDAHVAASSASSSARALTRPEDRRHGSDGDDIHDRAVFISKPSFFGFYRSGGVFKVDVCLRCFHADWYGTHLGQLTESEKDGIYRVTRGHAGPSGGPYR